jgi:ParB/RepB/Spo0J family partition protein
MKKIKAIDAPSAATPAVGEFKSVPHDQIQPDPNQPRKAFDETKLKELADSIRSQGIVQPLALEFIPAKFKIIEPDLSCSDYQLMERMPDGTWLWRDSCAEKSIESLREVGWPAHFESRAAGINGKTMFKDSHIIVCGERRWRAAGIVGLKDVPAIVFTALTDQQRFDMQFIENNQRENITALEEAEALKGQLAKRRMEDSKFSPEDLAKELGMSRAALYEKLKLTRLHPPIREALLAGKVSVSIAGEIAKVPTPKAQEQLLEEISKAYRPLSVRDVQELIEEEYVKQLSEAPFSTTKIYPSVLNDALLDTTCTACPYRTGNMLEEFPDLKTRPNVCTNPACFGEKCKAHWLETADEAREKGKKVFTEKEFRKLKSDYIDGGKHEYAENRNGTFEQLMGKHKPEAILVATAEGLKKYYPKAEVAPALRANGVKLYRSDAKSIETPEQKTKREAAEKEKEAERGRRETFAISMLPKLAASIDKIKDADAWKILAKDLDAESWRKTRATLLKHVKTDRARVLVDSLEYKLDDVWRGDGKDAMALWKTLGFDFAVEFEKSEKENAPALPLAKAEPKQGDLIGAPPARKSETLTAAQKARIVAAQKARWAKVKAAKK